MLDIETAPHQVYVWRLFGNQYISPSNMVSEGYTLCYTAKWYGSDKVYSDSLHASSIEKMVGGIHKLIDEADAVVHYNGNKFDIPILNTEFVLLGLPPPSPSKQMDLYNVVKKRFRFPSNKLEYVVKALGLGEKDSPPYETWKACMAGNKQAWKTMIAYNKKDVLLLERLYVKLLPWIKNHANQSLYRQHLCCPNCGSGSFQSRGSTYTSTAYYKRLRCNDCGNWFRTGKSEAKGPDEKGVNI